MMGMGFGLGWIGLILMLVFLVVVIGLAVWLLSNLFPRAKETLKTSVKDQTETPMEVLKRRYARGEISRAEFDEMQEVLRAELR
jgi:putative membrane protein